MQVDNLMSSNAFIKDKSTNEDVLMKSDSLEPLDDLEELDELGTLKGFYRVNPQSFQKE